MARSQNDGSRKKSSGAISGASFLRSIIQFTTAANVSKTFSEIESYLNAPRQDENYDIYLKKGLYIILENLFMRNTLEKLCALYVRKWYDATELKKRTSITYWISQIFLWLHVSMDLPCDNTLPGKQLDTNDVDKRKIISECLNIVRHDPGLQRKFSWAKFLLLRRIFPRLMILPVYPDLRILVLLLYIVWNAECPPKMTRMLLGILVLSSMSSRTSYGNTIPRMPNFSSETGTGDPMPPIVFWSGLYLGLFSLPYDSFDFIPRRVLINVQDYEKGINGAFMKSLQAFHGQALGSRATSQIFQLFFQGKETLSNGSTDNVDLDSLGSYGNALSVRLYMNQFTIYQVMTPSFAQTLTPVWEALQEFSYPPLSKLQRGLQDTAFRYHVGLDSPLKQGFLKALDEALCCSRPRYRHGACLAFCPCPVKATKQESCWRNFYILSSGRNEVIKDATQVHRVGAVRHAEIACALQLFDSFLPKPSISEMKTETFISQDSLDLSGLSLCVYIVEIDDFGIGYWEAHACPLCTLALQKVGVQAQHYSSPVGVQIQTFSFLPNIPAPTLDPILKLRQQC